MRHSYSLVLFFCVVSTIGFVFSSCSSKFIVKSDPLQADVFVLDAKTLEKKPLGKTPLDIPSEEVKKAVTNAPSAGEFMTVVVEKPGFQSQSFNLPVTKFTTLQTALDVKMKKEEEKKPEEDPKKQAKLAKDIAHDLLAKIFLAQRLAISQQYERAHIELDQVLKEYPEFARALTMRAAIYFAQKNYQESLKWYEAAIKADPQMEDAVKMMAKVRGQLGMPGGADNRMPATTPAVTPTNGGK